MREEGWDDPVRVASGGCGVAPTPQVNEAPIYVDVLGCGGGYVSAENVEAAYAELQKRRRDNELVTVAFTRRQAARLVGFFAWDCSIPTAIQEYAARGGGYAARKISEDAVTSIEMHDFRNTVVNSL